MGFCQIHRSPIPGAENYCIFVPIAYSPKGNVVSFPLSFDLQMKEMPAQTPAFDIETINQLIRQRRSIFPQQFSGEPVARELVELMLENANWAPTHGRTEPWRFIVFSGASLTTLAERHAALYQQETPAEKFKQEKYDTLKIRPVQASHVIAICMEADPSGRIPEIEEIEATACAVQNLHLTATALGLAGYWSSGGMTYHEGMKEILGLTATQRCLGFFYLGHFAGPWPEGKRRTDGGSKVRWIEGA
jgi:nitroreductase